eukprot:10373631-Heterocapsa_arctica.AAC.1
MSEGARWRLGVERRTTRDRLQRKLSVLVSAASLRREPGGSSSLVKVSENVVIRMPITRQEVKARRALQVGEAWDILRPHT